MLEKMIASNLQRWRRLFSYWSFLLVFWGFYRFLFRFPEEIEEGVIKPLVWLGPVVAIIVLKEKGKILSSLGWRKKNIFASLRFGLWVGIFLAGEALLVNYFKNRHHLLFIGSPYETPALFWSAFALSAVTAFSEETAFRGFILKRALSLFPRSGLVNFWVSLSFTMIHFPAAFFVYHYPWDTAIIYFLLVFLMSLVAGYGFIKTRNTLAAFLVHLLWWWPLILFR